jgi:DNA-3-methyladenine glycosylase
MGSRLPLAFFRRPDVVAISRELLGKWVFTRLPGDPVTGGRIVETEAYAGPEDRASHAYGNRRTARTEAMYRAGGVAYVYFCYGMHHMLNVVTHSAGVPHAILIRAIEPMRGVETMVRRCGRTRLDRTLTSGPGRVARALGLDRRHNGLSLRGRVIWIEDCGEAVAESAIVAGPRVGVAYAGPHARRLWRFRMRHSVWTSRAK